MIKRVSCIIICSVTIFVMMFNMFVPVKSYANVDFSTIKAKYSDGGGFDWSGVDIIEHNVSFTWYESRRWHYLCINCESYVINSISDTYINITFTNCSSQSYSFSNYYGEKPAKNGGLVTNSSYTLNFYNNANSYYYFAKEDTSFFGRLWQGLKNMWYSDKDSTIDFLFGDDNIVDYWDNIGNNWCDFVKTILDIDDSDTSTLNAVMTDIYNNDYSRDYWTNIDTNKITQIQNTSNNIKQFWNNNVTVVNDDDNNYHYEIKNYNSTTNTYPSYLYNENYFYEYLLYNIDTNNDDVVYWLKRIYSILVDYFSKDSEDFSIDESSNEEFLKQLKTIIVKKIPLWSQCIEILEPVTNTCIDALDNDTIDLIEDNHTALLTEKYSISALNSDSQLDIDTTYDTMLFNNLLIITTDVGNNVLFISIPVNENWLGYEFKKFDIPFSHYYNNFRQRISDLLLFLGWLLFAWSVIHRTSKLFGHNSSSKE